MNNNNIIYKGYENKKGKFLNRYVRRYIVIYDNNNKLELNIYSNENDYKNKQKYKLNIQIYENYVKYNENKNEIIIENTKLIFEYNKKLYDILCTYQHQYQLKNEKKNNENITTIAAEVERARSNDMNYQVRNWNEEFQSILESINDNTILDEEDKFLRLSALARDFVATSTELGRTIISEVAVPNSQKTIKPLNLGIAGGQKFFTNGVFFKFAIDDKGLLGSNEYAAKVANHELNSMVKLYQCEEKTLKFPLMCLIDYRGYRLVAMSALPLDDSTLIYGSNDGGTNIHADDETFNNTMKRIGHKLNLAGHNVKDKSGRKALIFGPFDMEGHRGKDDRYYCLDFARLFPCEPPNFGPKTKNAALHRLLRPELVRTHNVPLSSDAFISLGGLDRDGANEICQLHNYLLENVIPELATFLNQQSLRSDVHRNLSAYIHHYGVNLRYIGYLRPLVNKKWQRWLLIEAVARVLKQLMRKRFRALTRILQNEKLQLTTDEVTVKFLDEALVFLNDIFGIKNNNIWENILIELNEKRFVNIILPEEEKGDLYTLLLNEKLLNDNDNNEKIKSPKHLDSPQNENNNNNWRTNSSKRNRSKSPKNYRNNRRNKSKSPRRRGNNNKYKHHQSPKKKQQQQKREEQEINKNKLNDKILDEDRCMPLLSHILLRFCEMLSFQLNDVLIESIKKGDKNIYKLKQPFERTSLLGMNSTVKRMSIVSYSEGTALLIQGVRVSRMPIKDRKISLSEIGELARIKFDEALSHSLDDPATLANYSFLAEVLLNDINLALSLQKRSTDANPYHIRSWYYYGQTFYRLKNNKEAERCFLKAIEVSDEKHPNSLKDYANLLRFRGELSKAEEYYRKALAADPAHTRSLSNLSVLLTQHLYKKLENYDEIYDLIGRCALAPLRGLKGESAWQFYKNYAKWLCVRAEIFILSYCDNHDMFTSIPNGTKSYASILAGNNTENNNNNNNMLWNPHQCVCKWCNEMKLSIKKNNNTSLQTHNLPIKKPRTFSPLLLENPQRIIPRIDNYKVELPHTHSEDIKSWPIKLLEADFCFRLALYFVPSQASYWLNYADFLLYYANDIECAEYIYRKALEVAIKAGEPTKGLRRARAGPTMCYIALAYFLILFRQDNNEANNCIKLAIEHELKHDMPRGDVFLCIARFYWKYLLNHNDAMREYMRAVENSVNEIIVIQEYIEYLETLLIIINNNEDNTKITKNQYIKIEPKILDNQYNDELKLNVLAQLKEAEKKLLLLRRQKNTKKKKNTADLKFTLRVACQEFRFSNKKSAKKQLQPIICRSRDGLSTFYCQCRDKGTKHLFDHPEPFNSFLHKNAILQAIVAHPVGTRNVHHENDNNDVLAQAEAHVMIRSQSHEHKRKSVSSVAHSIDSYSQASLIKSPKKLISAIESYNSMINNQNTVPKMQQIISTDVDDMAYNVYTHIADDGRVISTEEPESESNIYNEIINDNEEKKLPNDTESINSYGTINKTASTESIASYNTNLTPQSGEFEAYMGVK